jgi:hypothetical protein
MNRLIYTNIGFRFPIFLFSEPCFYRSIRPTQLILFLTYQFKLTTLQEIFSIRYGISLRRANLDRFNRSGWPVPHQIVGALQVYPELGCRYKRL